MTDSSPTGTRPTIVVRVDGSPSARQAMGWALSHAPCPVVVVSGEPAVGAGRELVP